jgi:hypothetical protein
MAYFFKLNIHIYSVTRQMTKQFCPECGNPSLQRASVSVDSSGQRHYYLAGRYRPKARVCVFK